MEQNFDKIQEELVSSLLGRGYEFETDDEEISDLDIRDVDGEAFGIVDEEDRKILLHRDAHFGGSFSLMQDYYSVPERRGVMDDISLNRINFLSDVEHRLGRNLAPLMLSGADAEKVAHARKLQAEVSQSVLADVILHEEEEIDLELKEWEKFKDHPEPIFKLAESDDFRDDLATGYGKSPIDAIKLIGKLKLEGGIELLFRLLATTQLASSELDEEDEILHSLTSYGEPVLEKAIMSLTSKPLTPYHEKIALLLLRFLPSPGAQECAEKLLRERDVVFSRLGLWLLLALETLNKKEKEVWYSYFTEIKAPHQFMEIASDVLRS